ncbi:hypothetical protein AVEN_267667-1 [Araneus ventricosus]|uniref:Uncharacterized protein n=1 Tax=Araneus ventricosus TaxID=182803 RepID=A0A4Y2NGW3_ARAVE|nr:hypothetical protein AVEN_267667-1 [Araneus ventricosus]
MLDTGVFMESKNAWLQICFEASSLSSAVDVTKERCSHILSVEAECGRVLPSIGGFRKLAGGNCGFPSSKGAGNGVGGGRDKQGDQSAISLKKHRGSIESEINTASGYLQTVVTLLG